MNPEDRLLYRITALAARIEVLESERAACGLMHRYAAALDEPDPDMLARLFTAEGTLRTSRGTFRGHDEIAGFFRSARAADDSDKRHFVCQPDVRSIDARRVALDCYFSYIARGSDSMLGWGTYAAVCRVESGIAVFDSLNIAVHLGTDLTRGWHR
ncbi:nuclear transport factor 2 family protein [Rhodococcus zopfii]|uniref:Nuclear transport factor 2 family protein n=1 Tax=Rhodococcus zopfii TaxID=43772 RepID=A0ABU3WXA2_9NOCA|nr:nuclear transport factor 2 family protein [Rhodococcus zopfii]